MYAVSRLPQGRLGRLLRWQLHLNTPSETLAGQQAPHRDVHEVFQWVSASCVGVGKRTSSLLEGIALLARARQRSVWCSP